jgi:hypothetical protein
MIYLAPSMKNKVNVYLAILSVAVVACLSTLQPSSIERPALIAS